jgi:bifunctional UDP-N-acetylglucosamine pyrophosphorylase/glucosamine-1-phosphate N-acetyltransferase
MNSVIPKLLQTIAGKPIIRYVIDLCKSINPKNLISVISKNFESNEFFEDVKTVVQTHPKGTANAVLHAIPYIDSEYVIVTCGDVPLLEKRHLDLLISDRHPVSFLVMEIPDELACMPYGRVILDNDSSFQKVVEYKNATDFEKEIKTANTGIYKFEANLLRKYIKKIEENFISKEFYLTDILEILKADGIEIFAINTEEYWPFHGINTMEDLSKAEKVAQSRLRKAFMEKGVKLCAPDSIYFSYDTSIEADVTIEPNVVFGKNVKIKSGSVIKSFSYISDCEIMNDVEIGPFARLRGNSKISPHSSVGNFVEIKQTTFGKSSKAKHLSYIGNSVIGESSNIGAGTIICNYDGVKKHDTVIGDNVFVGSNSTLIAPIEIENNSIIAAGSVINRSVSQNSLAISRVKQEEIKDGATKVWKKKRKL